MRSRLAVLLLFPCAIGCATTQPGTPATTAANVSTLPVRSVRLYETGIGYFERAGRLSPGSDTISLPAAKVDDALKTLVVLSDGARVKVTAVEFPSVLSDALARAQAGLPTSGGRLSYSALLESLRGAEVEVSASGGARYLGRLIDVTEVPRAEAGAPAASAAAAPAPSTAVHARAPLPRFALALLTREHGLVRLDSTEIAGVRPTDGALAARLDSALSTTSDRGAQAPRLLRVSTTNDEPVRIGYIAETPAWRVTYRLLLGKDGEPATLQGWALVHNDSDEPWQQIALEIVNGRPNSFLYPLTAPRYLRRPLATPEQEMSTLPQLASRTVDQIWGDHAESSEDETGEAFGEGGLGLSGIGEGGGGTGQGYGSGHGMLSGSHRVSSPTSEINVGNLAEIMQSEALPSGTNFRYRLSEPITLGAHSSALVPFTQLALAAEAMTRFSWGGNDGHATARVSNGSGQTLPGGPIAIYTGTGLAGESALARLASGDSTWLSYGDDLDVAVTTLPARVDTTRTELVRLDPQGRLVEHYLRHREQPLSLENRSVLPRTLCIELPVVVNAKVAGADRLLYDGDQSAALALFAMKPRSKLEKTLIFDEGLQRASELASLTPQKLAELAGSKELDPASRAVLLEGADLLLKGAEPAKQQQQKQTSLTRLEADRGRLKETIETLKGTSGNGTEPLVRRLVELEKRRNELEVELKTGAESASRRLAALRSVLERLNPAPPKPKLSH
ncbi:MAG TPA: hypothetical protein VG937_14405 [Polyangiaceae bacterium]|nr:hypothetical protein [Polyangiaceae bacterium]